MKRGRKRLHILGLSVGHPFGQDSLAEQHSDLGGNGSNIATRFHALSPMSFVCFHRHVFTL